MLERVGLDEGFAARFPHELSGGQAQRVAIARALIVNPKVLVCDEAVAALDGSVRRQILALLRREQDDTGLSVIFISHDLAVVRSISHRVLVLYLGRLVELADGESMFERPMHPYTRALLDAVPVPDPLAPGGRLSIKGEVPSILEPPSGCAFHPRCRHADARCKVELPLPRTIDGAEVACHHAGELR
jgi:oligopeptide/dipeptide ABC transporter ATP-binding protein